MCDPREAHEYKTMLPLDKYPIIYYSFTPYAYFNYIIMVYDTRLYKRFRKHKKGNYG